MSWNTYGYGTALSPVAEAQWKAPDGRVRTGLVPIASNAVAGNTVMVWTDLNGQGRIVVVRGPWRPANQAQGPVVVGVDGSPTSREAAAYAFEEAALHMAPLLAVCALADAAGSLGCPRQVEEDFSLVMDIQEKEHPGVSVIRHIEPGSPRTALLTAAAGARLLIVGSRGRGGIDRMTLGSVAYAVLNHAPCPVEVVHAVDGRVSCPLGGTRVTHGSYVLRS